MLEGLKEVTGGEGGIRTLEGLATLPVFETGTFNHSATSPGGADSIRKPAAWQLPQFLHKADRGRGATGR